MILRYHKLRVGAFGPQQSTKGSAGYDLPIPETIIVQRGQNTIPLGIALELPPKSVGLIQPRSSAWKRKVYVHGVIDSDYRGEVYILAYNFGDKDWLCLAGDSFAQLLVLPLEFVQVEESQTALPETDRKGGLGSTGRGLQEPPEGTRRKQ